jgi:hypothetical protein
MHDDVLTQGQVRLGAKLCPPGAQCHMPVAAAALSARSLQWRSLQWPSGDVWAVRRFGQVRLVDDS